MNPKSKEFDNRFGLITQRLLEIAEGKRPIEEWNDTMTDLYNLVYGKS